MSVQVKVKLESPAKRTFLEARKRMEHYETAGDILRDASLLDEYIKDDILHEAQTGKESQGFKEIIRLLASSIEVKARKLRRCY